MGQPNPSHGLLSPLDNRTRGLFHPSELHLSYSSTEVVKDQILGFCTGLNVRACNWVTFNQFKSIYLSLRQFYHQGAAEGTTCTVTSTDPAQQGECGTADYCTNEGGNLLSSSDCWQAPNRGTPGSGGGGTPAWGCCVSANADQGGL